MLSGRFIEILNVSLTSPEKFLVPYIMFCFSQNEQIIFSLEPNFCSLSFMKTVPK
jgi:hypothetical protein